MADSRRTRRLILALTSALVVMTGAVATNAAAGTDRRHPGSSALQVELYGLDGSAVGWVTMREVRDKVVVKGVARGLTPGFHGFHVHAVGVCDPAAPTGPFTTAGGHYAGALPNHGDHAGDLPSLLVMTDGTAYSSFATDRFDLDDLRDTDGSAVMVHAGRDNFANIPTRYTAGGVAGPDATTLATGDAGGRVACGVIPPLTH
ncbi:MAG TPA: superoxide dismutase family protein [Nocardioides sp.]|nr:superoxide dismutase family protein [Nocardioides sp.]